MAYVGRSVRVFYDGELIAACRSKTVSFTREGLDETDGDDDGWQRFNQSPGERSVTVSVDGVATAANFRLLEDILGDAPDELPPLQVTFSSDFSLQSAGAFLEQLNYTGEDNGAVTFSATILLSAMPTFEASGLGAILLFGELVAGEPYLTWTEVENAESYTLYRSDNGGAYAAVVTISAALPREYTDESAPPGNVYDYYIVANSSGGSTSQSNVVRIQMAPVLIFLGTGGQVYRSQDCGETWTAVGQVPDVGGGEYQNKPDLIHSPTLGGSLGRLVASRGSVQVANNVYYSDDLGETWAQGVKADTGNFGGVGEWFEQEEIFASMVFRNQGALPCYSDDGINWSVGSFQGSIFAGQGYGMVVDNRMKAVLNSGFFVDSADGITYTYHINQAPPNYPERGIGYNPTNEIYFSRHNSTFQSSRRFVHSDAPTAAWDNSSIQGSVIIASFQWIEAAGYVLAIGDGSAWSTTDGTDYTVIGAPGGNHGYDSVYDKGYDRVVCVGLSQISNQFVVRYSDDHGVTWNSSNEVLVGSLSIISANPSAVIDEGPFPDPVITSLDPDTIEAGLSDTVIVNGSLFSSVATVRINGVEQVTTWISDSQLSFFYEATEQGIFTVDVVQGSAVSNELPLTISAPGDRAFWRMLIPKEPTAANAASCAEFELRETAGGADVANGGTASAADTFSGSFVAANAFDNNNSTFWASAGTADPRWLAYQLTAATRINEITWRTRPDGAPNAFGQGLALGTVQSSADGLVWVDEWDIVDANPWASGEQRTYTRP